MTPMTLPERVTPAHLSEPEIDMDALKRAAAPNDNSPVVVTRRYLKQVERELQVGRMARLEVARMLAMDTVIDRIASTLTPGPIAEVKAIYVDDKPVLVQ